MPPNPGFVRFISHPKHRKYVATKRLVAFKQRQAQVEQITHWIHLIRGQKVMLDTDLAELYDVPTKVFNQAVKRNRSRFPSDFMFQLKAAEARGLKSQNLRSQIVTSSSRH